MSDVDPFEIKFPPVGPKNLIRLREDLLHASAALFLDGWDPAAVDGHEYISSISDLIPRDTTSPTDLSIAEATALAGTFREATSILSSPTRLHYSSHLWLRLYALALLRESRIFLNVELCDESPGYAPAGFADTWKGVRHGEPVSIKTIRTRNPIRLREMERTFRHEIDGCKHISHPNVLPIIEVSNTLFPFCIMSPWMTDGNITQYTQVNPSANRLTLLAQACQGLMYLHGLGVLHGSIAPSNILITRDGQACLGEFGITAAFRGYLDYTIRRENIQYIAPEHFSQVPVLSRMTGPSKAGDVYSLAMTSYSVLTGALPYDNNDGHTVAGHIRDGLRPPHPTDLSHNRWLRYPVWDVITIGWSNKPEHRCEVFVVYQVFSKSSLTVESAHLERTNAREEDSLGPGGAQDAEQDIKTGPQQRGKLLSRVTSLFQPLRGSESEIQRRVNEMDKLLENQPMSNRERLKLFNKLCKICSRHLVIPKSMHIPDCSEDSEIVESGGFADVSRGTYQGRRVAIKVIRAYITSDLDAILSRFCREGVVWKYLRHPNILPLLGVTINEHRFALVSEWMENGDINEFVKRDLHVNRTELLAGAADGLKYMHDLHVIHGDLKGANILINKDRKACLHDFGLSTITAVTATTRASRASLISNDTLMSFTGGGTRRWMSPEGLDPERFGMPESEDNRPTRQSDCYALGMVIYEVLCGHHPYLEFESDILAVNAILEGIRPKKPDEAKSLGFSNELWKTVELCWLEDRNARPAVGEILSCLNDAAAFWYIREL